MELLDQYFAFQKKIYEHFGYVEDWVVIPLMDSTKYFWREDGESVIFAETEDKLDDYLRGDYYAEPIYTQRFLSKWVYRTDDFTMICCDTQTDGNKFLRVFDNAKERTNG